MQDLPNWGGGGGGWRWRPSLRHCLGHIIDGHIIDGEGIHCDPAKVTTEDDVSEWCRPPFNAVSATGAIFMARTEDDVLATPKMSAEKPPSTSVWDSDE